MEFLFIYCCGVITAFAGILAYEFFYFYDRKMSWMPIKEYLQDFLISLLSWIGFLLLITDILGEKRRGWPEKGYDYRLHSRK